MVDYEEMVRREAMEIVGARHFKGTLVTTSYDPDKHAIKGIIMPHEVESGWIPIAVQHAGDNFGMLVGPNVGTQDDLKGDQFDIEFEGGDANTPVAKHKHYSDVDNPPRVESGEIMTKHQGGGYVHYKKDNSIHHVHASGASKIWDKDGNWVEDNKDKDITVKTTGAYVQNTQNGNLA